MSSQQIHTATFEAVPQGVSDTGKRCGSWSDYGARWYMPELGRFTGVDPIASKFPHVNPYNYAENSPIGNIDLWGLQKVDVNFLGQLQMGSKSYSAAVAYRYDIRTGESSYALSLNGVNVVQGSYSAKNGNQVNALPGGANIQAEVIKALKADDGYHVPDFLGIKGLEYARKSIQSPEGQDINSPEGEMLRNFIGGVLTDAQELVKQGAADVYVKPNLLGGDKETGTDENGKPIIREFTQEYTLKTKELKASTNEGSVSGQIKVTYKNEKTTSN